VPTAHDGGHRGVEPLPPIVAANGCGITDPVRLSAVMSRENVRMPSRRRRRCAAPRGSGRALGARGCRTDCRDIGRAAWRRFNFDSYECRGRNRVIGAMLSEHGKGNAIDIAALTLQCRSYELTANIHVDKEVRERLKASACARFTTVLGPASEAFTRPRAVISPSAAAATASASGRCAMVEIVPLPRERPAEAPPRELDACNTALTERTMEDPPSPPRRRPVRHKPDAASRNAATLGLLATVVWGVAGLCIWFMAQFAVISAM